MLLVFLYVLYMTEELLDSLGFRVLSCLYSFLLSLCWAGRVSGVAASSAHKEVTDSQRVMENFVLEWISKVSSPSPCLENWDKLES